MCRDDKVRILCSVYLRYLRMSIDRFDNVCENSGLNQSSFIQSTYGAVSLLGFNGGTTEVVVRYNEFKNCKSNVNQKKSSLLS